MQGIIIIQGARHGQGVNRLSQPPFVKVIKRDRVGILLALVIVLFAFFRFVVALLLMNNDHICTLPSFQMMRD